MNNIEKQIKEWLDKSIEGLEGDFAILMADFDFSHMISIFDDFIMLHVKKQKINYPAELKIKISGITIDGKPYTYKEEFYYLEDEKINYAIFIAKTQLEEHEVNTFFSLSYATVNTNYFNFNVRMI